MNLRHASGLLAFLVFAGLDVVVAQQAVTPAERATLTEQLPTTTGFSVNANGAAQPEIEDESDDGLGEQIVLQPPARPPIFFITGDASMVYTNNAALTRDNTIDDAFFVANLGLSWVPSVPRNWRFQLAAHGSVFRYDKTPSLDFQTFGVGAGVSLSPQTWNGIEVFANYDFIEMLDRHSEEILQDHAFTVGTQRTFALDRAQGITAGALLMVTLSEPESAQRDLAGLFVVYRFQATQALDFQLGYRLSGYAYDDGRRLDLNQIITGGAHYQLWKAGGINAFFSLASNRSEDSAFDYTAIGGGGGLSASFQF